MDSIGREEKNKGKKLGLGLSSSGQLWRGGHPQIKQGNKINHISMIIFTDNEYHLNLNQETI